MNIGRINNLEILKTVDFGVYLDSGDGIEILMPRRYVPENVEVGDFIDAFIYRDSEDRLIATTLKPLVMVGECACLTVKAVTRIGAFLDWGLPKDLLLPYNQMGSPMKEGDRVVIHAYLDERTGRIAATSRLSLFLKETGVGFHVGQQVSLLIASRSDLGIKAVINGTHLGLIFHTEIDGSLPIGEKVKGFIKRVRSEDQRIDLALDAKKALSREGLNDEILRYLKEHGGKMTLTDKSSPEEIMEVFSVSKGAFKKALGALYKDRCVEISSEFVQLTKATSGKAKKAVPKKKTVSGKRGAKAAPPKTKNEKSEKASGSEPKVKSDTEQKPVSSGKNKVESKPRSRTKSKPKSDKLLDDRQSAESGSDQEEFIPPDSPWARSSVVNKKQSD